MARTRLAEWAGGAVWYDLVSDGAGTALLVVAHNATAQDAVLRLQSGGVNEDFRAPAQWSGEWSMPVRVATGAVCPLAASYPAGW